MQKIYHIQENFTYNTKVICNVSKKIINSSICIIPTETVYGLVGLAYNPLIADRICAIKNRLQNKSFSVIFSVADDVIALQPIISRLNNDNLKKLLEIGCTIILKFDRKNQNIKNLLHICKDLENDNINTDNAHSAKLVQNKSVLQFDAKEENTAQFKNVDQKVANHNINTLQQNQNIYSTQFDTEEVIKNKNVSDFVSLGVRVPQHDTCREIIEKTGPLIATSVNISGMSTSRYVANFSKDIIDNVDFVIEDDKSVNGYHSSIIDLTNSEYKILRSGLQDSMVRHFFDIVE